MFEDIIESTAFFGDKFVCTLLDKLINQGFGLEEMKETFKIYFKKNGVDLNSILMSSHRDLSQVIDEEKFFYELVNYRMERVGSSPKLANVSSNQLLNSNDYAENKENEEDATTKMTAEMTNDGSSLKTRAILKYLEQRKKFIEFKNQSYGKSKLKDILIDGNNVALHTDKQNFHVQNIRLAFDYFKMRGHSVKVILGAHRVEMMLGASNATLVEPSDQKFLRNLLQTKELVLTPYKMMGNKRFSFNDDLVLLGMANKIENSIIVSNDQFRKHLQRDEFKKVIEKRILMYLIVDSIFLPVDDPLGPSGPTLDNFLRIESTSVNQLQYMQKCPYKKKCTFGIKCKYFHPERLVQMDAQEIMKACQAIQNLMKQE